MRLRTASLWLLAWTSAACDADADSHGIHSSWLYPTSFYEVSTFSPFGQAKQKFGGKRHLGEDIERPAGSAVFAIGSGKVTYVKVEATDNADCKGWGTIVVIGHPQARVSSIYAHLGSDIKLRAGDPVSIGQQIGKIGHYTFQGKPCYRDHLHFAIYRGLFQTNGQDYPSALIGYVRPGLFPARYCRPAQFIRTGECVR